jgi:hypothetical protein
MTSDPDTELQNEDGKNTYVELGKALMSSSTPARLRLAGDSQNPVRKDPGRPPYCFNRIEPVVDEKTLNEKYDGGNKTYKMHEPSGRFASRKYERIVPKSSQGLLET